MKKTNINQKAALVRECAEELGVNVQVDDLFTTYKLAEIGKEQCEYFYFCKIINGELGSGSGPEFQKSTHYEGVYILEWVSLKDFSSKNIQPEKAKKKLQI